MPELEVADILREYAHEYVEKHGPTSTQERRVLKALQLCRTSALGGHVEECNSCGHREISYNSCRNGHCPKCQAGARRKWLSARESELLPVEYFHVVFTIPKEFRLLAFQNKEVVYGILFRAAAETLCQVARDPRHLGAQIGVFGILHTWGQNLSYHPHVHFVVPGGGLSADRTSWISAPRGFFLPLKVIKLVFRGKFIDFLKRAFAKGELVFHGELEALADPEAFEAHLTEASKHEWVVYAKPPFGGPKQVLKYLARYTHRVAISNQRLVAMEDGKITFRWKDYTDHSRIKHMTLSAFEFIRRFLLHILPSGFHRIRYYGFLATRTRTESIALCRKLILEEVESPVYSDLESEDRLTEENGGKPCPVCNEGVMVILYEVTPVGFRRTRLSLPEIMDTS